MDAVAQLLAAARRARQRPLPAVRGARVRLRVPAAALHALHAGVRRRAHAAEALRLLADSRDTDRHKAPPPAEKFGGRSSSSSSSACQYLDLTANDTPANSTPNCKSGATPTSTSTRATAQLTSASSRTHNQRAQRTQAAVKRKASEKATTAHSKITMFFDRLSQRTRNATEDANAAPVTARASNRSSSSCSTTVSDIATHSELTDTSPLIMSADGEPSANTAIGATSCPALTSASSDPSAPSTASSVSASVSGSGGSKERAGAGADADANARSV